MSTKPVGSRAFFEDVERHRYTQEAHLPRVARFGEWGGKRVLEVGCGLGTDLLQFARGGARCTGIDLTSRAVELAAAHFAVHAANGRFGVADAEKLGFASDSFDLVYSHGVLHHTPDITAAIDEVHRVLKPGGTAIVMLYHKHSLNYWVNIRLLRRAALMLLRQPIGRRLVYRLAGAPATQLGAYEALARERERWTAQDVLNNNTDGAGNPLSSVFTRRDARKLFRKFRVVRTEVHWLVKKNIPGLRVLPPAVDYYLGRLAGWDLYIIATK